MSGTRKKMVLSIDQKLSLFNDAKLMTAAAICSKHGIRKSKFYETEASEMNMKAFVNKETGNSGSGIAKTMKQNSYPKLDEALFIWMRQMREKNITITGPMLKEKAVLLIPRLYTNQAGEFTACTCFIWRFCKRHNLSAISVLGEIISADKISAESFCLSFRNRIREFNLHQIFNCDETDLWYKLTPRTTLK